jgi:hypothetical protein
MPGMIAEYGARFGLLVKASDIVVHAQIVHTQ